MASSKDITKVALAGTAVVGLVVIYYLYTKRSKSQDADKKSGAKSKESSPVKKVQTQTEPKKEVNVPENIPEPNKTKPKPESKIPQKIGSKPQSVVKPEPVPDSKAGGEIVPVEKKDDMKDEIYETRDKEIQNNDPSKISGIVAEQPKEQIASPVLEKKAESILSPIVQVPPIQPVQQPSQEPEGILSKSEFSITLSSPPVSQQPDITSNTPSTGSPVVENGKESLIKDSDSVQNGTEDPPQSIPKPGLDMDRITKALQQASSSPASVDKETLDTLVILLRQKDVPLLQSSLDCIVRCGAFSQNQRLLRECGCIQELTLLLKIHAVGARAGSQTSQNLLGSLNNAIINLCMDIQNQARLEVCIPDLIDLITYPGSPEDVQLMSLKSLTNLSTTPSYHDQYIVAIPRLYNMMDAVNSSIRLQAVKVLVNLSCNPEIIPDLLQAKTPKSLLKCLEMQTDSILLLRVVTLLVNLVSCVKDGKIGEEQLPALNDPAYANSVFMTIFSENETLELKMRIQDLRQHSTDNVSKQAIRLFEYIK